MKLSKAQLQYVEDRREWIEQRDKDIRSIGDDLYKSQNLVAELIKLGNERQFFNHMIRLHNAEARAEPDFTPIV